MVSGTHNRIIKDHNSPIFELVLPRLGIRAEAVLRDGEFVVLGGSEARDEWRGDKKHTYAPLHADLLRFGVLRLDDDKCVFIQDHEFSSPSAASSVVAGSKRPGPKHWKVEGSMKTYGEWKEEQRGNPRP